MEIAPPIQIPQAKRRRRSLAVAILCWSYLFLLLALIAVIRIFGDRNWQGTLLLFAPRWAALLPLMVLVPLSIRSNRRMLIVLGLAIAVAIFPLMGFCIGWHRFTSARHSEHPGGMPMRIVAFNLHHADLTGPAARQFLTDTHPDVVAMEEVAPQSTPGLFPNDIWQVRGIGELLLASRYPILSARALPDDSAADFRLKTPSGPVDFVIVHLSSPHYALRDVLIGARQGRQELSRNINERTKQAELLSQLSRNSTVPLILAGDFNLMFDSRLFRGQFSGMTDSFEATGLGFGWTYQNHWTAVRIDRVLSSNAFAPRAFSLGPWLGSPHRPIIADLILR